MKITEGIKVDWHHNVPKKTTSCVLTVGGQVCIAVAKCAAGDQFSRAAGRKLTLTRVLKIANLPKDIRTEIWSVIWARGVKI